MTPLAVGAHRVQMDVQFLPKLPATKGFSCKISLIHLATRLKYS